MVYTLGEAAKACGKSKATISKAIKNGKISAKRNDNNSFSIEPVELHRVYPSVSVTVDSERSETLEKTDEHDELVQLRERVEQMQMRIDEKDQRISQLSSLLEAPKSTKRFWPWSK